MRGVVLSRVFVERLRSAPRAVEQELRARLKVLLRAERDPASALVRPLGPGVRELPLNNDWRLYYRPHGDTAYLLLTLHRVVNDRMVVDQVDAQDRPLATIPRNELFTQKVNFRVVHVFVFNSAGELLIQCLSPLRRRHPRRYGSSLAGYVFANEPYRQAAHRRFTQELRVPCPHLHAIGKTRMVDNGATKFLALYKAQCEGPFFPEAAHIAKVQFTPIPKVLEQIRRAPASFTPTFLHALAFYMSRETQVRGTSAN